VRGGGPLTTLVLPGIDPLPLWHMIWANVPVGRLPSPTDLQQVFPWLAPTRTADRFPATTPKEAHPLQVFWGMPRRIRLDFAQNPGGLPCDLTGGVDNVIATGWRQRKNGVKYVAWEHPLSATRRDANEGGWRAVQTPHGGIGYRDWVAFVAGDTQGIRRCARCITDWWQTRSAEVPGLRHSRLLAAGYEMDKQQIMKARGFVESEMPLPGAGPELARREGLGPTDWGGDHDRADMAGMGAAGHGR